jgi:hypothetical protein
MKKDEIYKIIKLIFKRFFMVTYEIYNSLADGDFADGFCLRQSLSDGDFWAVSTDDSESIPNYCFVRSEFPDYETI